jgi:hypothetical protein
MSTITDHIAQNLANAAGTDQQLIDGLKQMPISKMYEQIQYLKNRVLPQAKEKLGENSESYLFYSSLVDSLVWAIKLQSSFDYLSLKYNREKYFGSLMLQHRDALEAELLKYTTLDKLYLNMAIDVQQQTIAKQTLKP